MGFLDGIYRSRGGDTWYSRYEAGRALAQVIADDISSFSGKGVVLGLPRGGLVVAKAVAKDLNLPLDFRSVKKVGHPFQPEFAIGAVDISGVSVKNPYVDPSDMPLENVYGNMVRKALEQAKKMDRELRGDRENKLTGSDWAMVVDDGAATGLTILAVVKGLKSEGYRIYVGVPVSSVQAKSMLESECDGFYAVLVPEYFRAVGQFYEDFLQVTTDEARRCLTQ